MASQLEITQRTIRKCFRPWNILRELGNFGITASITALIVLTVLSFLPFLGVVTIAAAFSIAFMTLAVSSIIALIGNNGIYQKLHYYQGTEDKEERISLETNSFVGKNWQNLQRRLNKEFNSQIFQTILAIASAAYLNLALIASITGLTIAAPATGFLLAAIITIAVPVAVLAFGHLAKQQTQMHSNSASFVHNPRFFAWLGTGIFTALGVAASLFTQHGLLVTFGVVGFSSIAAAFAAPVTAVMFALAGVAMLGWTLQQIGATIGEIFNSKPVISEFLLAKKEAAEPLVSTDLTAELTPDAAELTPDAAELTPDAAALKDASGASPLGAPDQITKPSETAAESGDTVVLTTPPPSDNKAYPDIDTPMQHL